MLNYSIFGEPSTKPKLLIVHGLFGSGRNWRAIARHFSRDRQIITVDMRNHGDSFWDDDNSYSAMAQDLADVINHIGAPVDLLGHSMGGKASMVLAFKHPKMINRMIIADISPVAYKHDQVSNVKIMQSLPLGTITNRSQADEILAHDINEPSVRAFFLQSLKLSKDGHSWQLNLDVLAKDMGKIVGFPEISGRFEGKCLFVRGGASPYITKEYMQVIERHFPNFILDTIEGAGHWLHAEKPREFISSVGKFIA